MTKQGTDFDLYQKQIDALPEGFERIDLINKYAWELCRIDPIKSYELSEYGFNSSEKFNYQNGKIASLRNLGQCNLLISNLKMALEKGLDCLKLLENSEDKIIEADAINIIGSVYAQSGDIDNAHLYYSKCVVIRKLLNDSEGEVRALNSIGDLYLKTKEFDKAEKLFLECLNIEHQNYLHKGIVLYNLGETCFHLNKEEEALAYIKQSMKIGEELNFTLMKVYCSLLLGEIHFKKKEYEVAIDFLNAALLSAVEVDSKDRIYLIHQSLADIYKNLGDFKKALEHHELYHSVKEIVFNEDNNQKIKTMQFQFQTQSLMKEAEIEKTKNIELQSAYDKIQKQRNEIEEKNKDITDSINYAQKIQQAILPDIQQLFASFSDAFVVYFPKDIISGDFYWVNTIKDTTIVAVADCTGHGVPGAFMSMLGHSYLSQIITDYKITNPAEILAKLDEKIASTLKSKNKIQDSNDGMDMALLSFNSSKMLVNFSGAKNPLYLLRDGELFKFKGDKIAIGGHDAGGKIFSSQEIQVKKEDLLYMTTDGYSDQFGGPNGKKFKESNLRELLKKSSSYPLSDQEAILKSTFDNWKGNLDQIDDVCLIGMKI